MRKFIFVTFLLMCSLGLLAQVADSTQKKVKAPLYYAADQSLFVMPTAYTMPKGTQSFTDYEVIVLQYTYAVGNNTHLSAIIPFPVTAEMLQAFTAGVKHNYLQYNKLESAVWASYMPYYHMLSVGNVFSYGSPKASVHFAGSLANSFDRDLHTGVFMLGGMKDVSSKLAIIVEAMSSSQIIDSNNDGLISFGVRFKGKETSWDLGAFRPISSDFGDLWALPFLKATFIF